MTAVSTSADHRPLGPPEKVNGLFYVKGHPWTETAEDRLRLCDSYSRTAPTSL